MAAAIGSGISMVPGMTTRSLAEPKLVSSSNDPTVVGETLVNI